MNEAGDPSRPADIRELGGGKKKKAPRSWRWLGILLLLAIFGTVGYVAWLGRRPAEVALEPARIAVLPFGATPRPNDAWLGWGLATMVSETLGQTSGIEVLPPDRLRQLLAQRGIELAAAGARAQARQLAIAAGAGLTVDGDFARQEDGRFRLRFELADRGGASLHQGELGPDEPLVLAGQLVESLASGMSPGIEAVKLSAVFGNDPFLARLYGEGVQQLAAPGPGEHRAQAAIPYFEILLHNDPTYLRAKARLVDSQRELGTNLPAVRQQAEQLLQESLPRGMMDLQVSTFRSLGLIDAVLGDEVSAAEQFRLGHRAALARQDKGGELQLLGDLVRLALARSDRNRAEELLVEMMQVQKAQHDQLGEADSLLQIGSLYLGGGDLEGAAKVLEESQKLVAAAGDDWGVQRVAASLGEIAWRRGDVVAAADHWEKALEFYRRQHDNQRILMMTRSLGEAQIRAGRYQQAEKLVIDLRELAAQLGDRTSEGEACVSQAWLQLRLGFPFQAREPLDCALARDTNLGDRKRLRQVIAWLAYEQGDYDLALRGWSEIKAGAGGAWSPEEEAFLQVFAAAKEQGRRLDLPGEPGYHQPE